MFYSQTILRDVRQQVHGYRLVFNKNFGSQKTLLNNTLFCHDNTDTCPITVILGRICLRIVKIKQKQAKPTNK